ncbi:transposase [Nonomuraea pusilla]|uniref:transposase n=1 Tax=Nonomuraea pusilla TaxID=46177 RepID=UPI00332C105F
MVLDLPDLRRQFNAVMWRFRTGSPWRDLPVEYGPRSTVYDRFRIWATAGVFEQLMQATIAEAAAHGQADLDLVSVDSATADTHPTPPAWSGQGAGQGAGGGCRTGKGLHRKGRTPKPANSPTTATGIGADAGSGD